MKFISVNCHVCQQTLSFLKNVKTECIESKKKEKKEDTLPQI